MDISVVNEMLSTSSPLQLLNAAFPILSIPEGKANEVMPVLLNAQDPMLVNVLGKVTLSKAEQSSKALSPMLVSKPLR